MTLPVMSGSVAGWRAVFGGKVFTWMQNWDRPLRLFEDEGPTTLQMLEDESQGVKITEHNQNFGQGWS